MSAATKRITSEAYARMSGPGTKTVRLDDPNSWDVVLTGDQAGILLDRLPDSRSLWSRDRSSNDGPAHRRR